MCAGSNFEATWDELDADGSGSLTTKELADHFGMGHLVQGTKEEEEAAMKKFAGGGVGSMAEIEAQLEELSQSELSGTAGGSMKYLFFWDIGAVRRRAEAGAPRHGRRRPALPAAEGDEEGRRALSAVRGI